MSRQATRASLGRVVLHGLLGWGLLMGGVAGILTARFYTADSARAPLPLLTATLSPAQARAWRSFPAYRTVVPVLVYHGIGGRRNYLSVSRTLFAEQMRALKVAGFHTLTIQQYAAFARGDTRNLPSRPILLTFDDGRLDAYREANAILQAYGFHATELVVPGWIRAHPDFSLNWLEIEQMFHSNTWNIEEHYGYGGESIRTNKDGRLGGAFADLEYVPAKGRRGGHLETLNQFKKRITGNMLWGEQQLRSHLPGWHPAAMAIPKSDYGQAYTNDTHIPHWLISWLNRHFGIVFGGDYLFGGFDRRFQIGGRFGRFRQRISYRLTMGPDEILPVLYCRLADYIKNRPIWREYLCLDRAKSPPQPAVPDGFPLPGNPVAASRRGDIGYQ